MESGKERAMRRRREGKRRKRRKQRKQREREKVGIHPISYKHIK